MIIAGLLVGASASADALAILGACSSKLAQVPIVSHTPPFLPVQPGDRVTDFSRGKAAAILLWAPWSYPAKLERDLLVAAASQLPSGSIEIHLLDITQPADSRKAQAIGGVANLPLLILLDRQGVVRKRYLGWPGKNPSACREILVRDLAALHRGQ